MAARRLNPVPREQNFCWGRLRWLWLPPRSADSQLAVSLVELYPGATIPPHHHLGEEQVLIVLSGEGHHRVNRRWSSLGPGEARRVPADCTHEMQASGKTLLRVLVLASATRSRYLHSPSRQEPARLLRIFVRHSGLAVRLVEPDGTLHCRPAPEPALCHLAWSAEKGQAVCQEILSSAARWALSREGPVPFPCCCPDTLSVAAVVAPPGADSRLLVVVGPLLTGNGNEQRVRAWAKRLGLPGDRELLARVEELPVAPVYRLWSAAAALQAALRAPAGYVGPRSPGAKEEAFPPPSPAHPLVDVAYQYLHSAPAARLKLAALSRELGVSSSHLSRIFALHAGCTFREYVRRIKVERAREMLASTSHPVRRIAAMCGYRDLSQFQRVFKRETGISPSGYRHRLRLSLRVPPPGE